MRLGILVASSITLGGVVSLASCASSDTSPLAAHGGDGAGGTDGTGGAGGVSGSAGNSAGSSGIAGSAGNSLEAGMDANLDVSPDVFVEPNGDPRLTFVHGLVDAGPIKLCLVPWIDGAPGPTSITPFPSGAGLAYAAASTVPAPSGVDLTATDIRPYVLSGDLSSVGSTSCATLAMANPATLGDLTLSPLPLLPAGTLSAQRSLLLVAVGCVSPTSTPTTACATDPTQTAASGVLVSMSRISSAASVGAQVLHASLSLPTANVTILDSESTSEAGLATVSYGTIAPQPPLLLPLESSFGTTATHATINVKNSNGTGLLYSVNVGDALTKSDLTPDVIAPGTHLVAVLVGPPSIPADAGLVNPPSVALVVP